jgi:hypothetical protein
MIIQHALALGNEKPIVLRDVEKAIWSCVFHIAANHQTEMQIRELVNKIDGITSVAAVPEVVSWFECSKFISLRWSHNN